MIRFNDNGTVEHLVGSPGRALLRRAYNSETFLKTFGGSTEPPPILPDYIRYISRDPYRIVVVFERPPEKRLVSYNYRDARFSMDRTRAPRPIATFEIQLPWMVYLASLPAGGGSLEYMYVFCSDHSLASIEDRLIVPPLPNLYGEGKVCFHQATPNLGHGSTLSSVISTCVGNFFDAPGNSDLALCNIWVAAYRHRYSRSARANPNEDWGQWLGEWEQMDLAEVLDWAKAPETSSYGEVYTIANVLEEIGFVPSGETEPETALATLARMPQLF